MNSRGRERCDRCKKWTSDHENLGTLEGIVSTGVDINHAICERCFNRHPASDRQYWDKWVLKNGTD